MSAHPLAVGTSVVGEPPLQTACLEKRHRQTLGQIRRDSQAERGQGTQMRRWGGGRAMAQAVGLEPQRSEEDPSFSC